MGKAILSNRLYRIYQCMKSRCYRSYTQCYPRYGGRGIKMCDEWLGKGGKGYRTFEKWALSNGYNDSLSIDRIDVNGNYEPSNCRWADSHTQSRNRRNNVYIDGMVLKDYARLHNMSEKTVGDRYARGKTGADLLKRPRHRVVILNGIEYSPNMFGRKYGFNVNSLQTAFNNNRPKEYIMQHLDGSTLDINMIESLETMIIES